jgi:methyl-accepting chemotaxis protein
MADLTRQVASVSKAMTEQATAATQITSATESMKVQSEQAARATAEQTRTMKEMTKSVTATARDIKTITQANKNQSNAAARLVPQLSEIRRITERNAEGVRRTRGGTADLLKQAETLTGLMDSAIAAKSTNGRGRAR